MKCIEDEMLEFQAFTNEFNNETDRGAALIAASIFDDRLKSILQAFLFESKASGKLTEGFNAPLGTFSSRLSAAYALGLLFEDEYRDIDTIRKIRNEFGHSWQAVTFKKDKIIALCKNLSWRGNPDEEKTATPRTRFNLAVSLLIVSLFQREKFVHSEQRKLPHWPRPKLDFKKGIETL
jgi:DNA-binding MltR family transcriptional regulator